MSENQRTDNNAMTKKNKTNNDIQNHTQKIKDLVT